MSLFQCENCGCCENTALSMQGFRWLAKFYDWSYAPERNGMLLCSACGPLKFASGEVTEFGQWHNRFPRTFLPKGMFVTNSVGNLAHRDTGDEDYMKYALEAAQ